MGGADHGAGTIKSERALLHNVVSPFWTGPLRSPQRLQNTFAHESFMDELAARAKADPVEFRLRHLSDPRMLDVVKAAAKTANWDARPSPKPRATSAAGIATGRGISCVAYEGDNGFSAMVAEVEVDLATGKLIVKRIVVSIDAGPISNPDGLRNQSEGGALQGMSRALGEEVTWDDHNVTSIDWRTYHSLPLGFAVPKIEVVLLNRPDHARNGRGRNRDHRGRRRNRKRHLRCDRRAHPASAVHARAHQGRAPRIIGERTVGTRLSTRTEACMTPCIRG